MGFSGVYPGAADTLGSPGRLLKVVPAYPDTPVAPPFTRRGNPAIRKRLEAARVCILAAPVSDCAPVARTP